MTTPDDGGKTPPAADDKHNHGDGPTMADVRKLVAEEITAALEPIKSMLGGKPGDKPADKPAAESNNSGAGDIDGMIKSAIATVLGDKDKAAAADEHQKEHDRLKEATAEKSPLDRPRRARWLGKIYDD